MFSFEAMRLLFLDNFIESPVLIVEKKLQLLGLIVLIIVRVKQQEKCLCLIKVSKTNTK